MHWKSRNWILIGLLLTTMAGAAGAQVVTTTVADTIYHADGTPATGTVILSWPAFTTSSGEVIPTGTTSATIATGGALSVQLVPNAGSTPMGSYYTAVYHLDDGSVSRQYWVVPVSMIAVKVSAIESTVLPASVAMQTVSKSYVDMAIAAAVGHPLDSSPYVEKAGDTMTGPLVLPGDPVSATQAADKNYVDESTAAFASGLAQKVSTMPSATQTVAQPVGTQLDVNNLNGVEYASQYVSGGGNNGIANAASSSNCTSGCEIVAEPTYTNENFSTATLNPKTHVQDTRNGRLANSYKDPLDLITGTSETAEALDEVSTQNTDSIAQQGNTRSPNAVGLSITQEGLTGGSNLFPEQIESPGPYFKMTYSAMNINGTYNTQGQHALVTESTSCFGVGDCLMGSHFLYDSGGVRDSADEGTHPYDLQTHEDYRVYTGTCATGCTTGATTMKISASANDGTQGDGRFLIDTSSAKAITSASTGGAIIGGASGTPHASAQFSGTSFPVSVFLSTGQVIPTQANTMTPGTVTIVIATTGVPAEYATNTAALPASSGIACVVDQNAGFIPEDYEMAPYTVVDATHVQLTLNKPHRTLATLAVGGLCGYGLEQTVDTTNGVRQVFPVVGSYSATGIYYASGNTGIVGIMNQTSAYLNLNASIASLSRTGNVVTVTTAGNLAQDVSGLTVTVAGAADSSYNGNFIATTTAANTFTYTQTGANSTSSGGTASVLTGGFVLYPMAEVLSVYDPATSSVDGQMTLAPNTAAWAASDPVEEPHYYQVMVTADTELVGQYVPRPTTGIRAGMQYQFNNGPGLTGWSIANSAPVTNYAGYGGTHGFPDAAYAASGVWHRTMILNAGEEAAFDIQCNLHGCGNWNSPYNLFELQSNAGADTVAYSPPTSTLTIGMRGAPYSFSPTSFTAGTINAGMLNVTTLNGSLSAASITSGTIAAARLPLFGASGSAHAAGIVPDPGATAGASRYLREDGTWSAPVATGSYATLDSNGRVLPGSAAYGGALGNDSSPYGLGPAIFMNGSQVASFYSFDSGGGSQMILGNGPSGHPWDGSSVQMYGGNGCLTGQVGMNSGDGGIFKNAGGCNNPMASLMEGINGTTTIDIEPDNHLKYHDDAGGSSYGTSVTFTGGAGASNCGIGAAFDPGSNDGAGAIVVGSSPPSACRITWQFVYVNATPGWAQAAPNCSVTNEGQRATATVTLTSNPNDGDTLTIEGVTLTFKTTVTTSAQIAIGSTAADTATNLMQYIRTYSGATPGAAPGVDTALTHYNLTQNPSSGVVTLIYNYLDGVTGNSVALSTSAPSSISVPATLSGGTLPSTRSVVAQTGTGGMVISAPGGTLNQGDVLTYTCAAYW